jgi:hypothetical protein
MRIRYIPAEPVTGLLESLGWKPPTSPTTGIRGSRATASLRASKQSEMMFSMATQVNSCLKFKNHHPSGEILCSHIFSINFCPEV